MRTSGILLPISSLPSPYGIGTLGKAAYDFVDFLSASGQSWWQILPPGPTGFGDSPYQSFSAMAGNPYFIDLDLLCADGLLQPDEIGGDWGGLPSRVDYGLLFERRFAVLDKAARRLNKTDPEYLAFCRENAYWLNDYALYMAIKEAHGQRSFQQWPEPLRTRQPAALKIAEATWGPRSEFWKTVQYFFFRQWQPLKAYANAQGVGIIGDIPIYVSPDSSDLWANPELFQVDAAGRPTAVAGVPPDAFSPVGQMWGNPLYDWAHHRRTRYAWWIARMRFAGGMFDITRIDHFRGFVGYYSIPGGAKNAETGEWKKGPGKDFIRALRRALPDIRIIAEDLGFLTPEVYELLRFGDFPGMKILQFAFDSREESDYLPHNYPNHTVVYPGTHDNTTLEGWQRTAPRQDVAQARRYLGLGSRGSLPDAMIRACLASVADTAVIPMQDWLHLGSAARINTPNTLGGNNWRWRLTEEQCSPLLASHIREQAKLYGRLSQAEKAKEKRRAAQQADENQESPRVLSRAGMRAAEEAAVRAGTGYEALMENAGRSAAQALIEWGAGQGGAKQALLLCGKGNNAGDAFVMGRFLAEAGWQVQWLPLAGEVFSPLAQKNLQRLPAAVQKADEKTAGFAAVVVDAVFGIGFAGELPDNVREAFRRAAAAPGLRVALDLPSGLDCDTGAAAPGAFKADKTIAFGAYKPGMLAGNGKELCGEVVVADIGL